MTCNKTKFINWQNEKYDNFLASDKTFWRYQTQQGMELKNGLAIDLITQKCKDSFTNLYLYQTGETGPVTVQQAYDAMCSKYCLENDHLHLEAMEKSSCSCLELSTPPSDPSYRSEGDYCQHNSARQLCEIHGFCGHWKCQLDDFMCPRYEYNKQRVALKGYGSSCFTNSANHQFSSGDNKNNKNILLSVVTVILLLYFVLQ